MSDVKITLVKSLSGRNKQHIETAHSLGLKKLNDVAVQPDNPQTRGKIAKIDYLLRVETVQ